MSKHAEWQAARKRTQVHGELMQLRSFEIEENLRAVDIEFGMPKIPKPPRPEPKSYRIENDLKSDREFMGRYKGYDIHVECQSKDEEPLEMEDFVDDDGEFDAEGWMMYDLVDPEAAAGVDEGMAYYIRVTTSGPFGTAYDGWWGSAEHTLEEAVEEALRGSCLITREQARFPHLWKDAA